MTEQENRQKTNQKAFICWMISLLFAMGWSIGWASLNSIFIKRIGIQYLPFTYSFNAIFCLLGSLVYLIFFADKIRHDISYGIFLFISIVSLLVPGLIGFDSSSIYGVLFSILIIYFSMSVFISQLAIQFWIIVNDLFSPSQGMRIYPIIGTSGAIGGIFGGWTANGLAQTIGSANLVLVWMFLLIIQFPFLIWLSVSFWNEIKGGEIKRDNKKNKKESIFKSFIEGVSYVKRSRFLIILAVMFMLYHFVGSTLEFQFSKVMSLTFANEDSLTAFFGLATVIFSATALFTQIFISSRIIRVIGVTKGLLSQPLASVISFFGLLFYFSFWPAFIFRYSCDFIGSSIQGNATQLAFNAVPSEFRGRVRSFMEGIVNPIGGMLAGLSLGSINMFIVGTAGMSIKIISLFGLILASAWLFFAYIIKEHYINSLLENLKSHDVSTQLNAIEALGERKDKKAFRGILTILETGTDTQKIVALRTFGNMNDGRAVRFIVKQLYNPKEAVALAAVDSLNQISALKQDQFLNYKVHNIADKLLKKGVESERVQISILKLQFRFTDDRWMPIYVEALLNNENPRLVANVIEQINLVNSEHLAIYLEPLLNHANYMVRATAVVALWKYEEKKEDLLKIIDDMLRGGGVDMRSSALWAIGELRLKKYTDMLIEMADSNELDIRRNAIIALIKLDHIKYFHDLAMLFREKSQQKLIASLISKMHKKVINKFLLTLIREIEIDEKVTDLLMEYGMSLKMPQFQIKVPVFSPTG